LEAKGDYEQAAYKYAEAEQYFKEAENEEARTRAESLAEEALDKSEEQRIIRRKARDLLAAGKAALEERRLSEAVAKLDEAETLFRQTHASAELLEEAVTTAGKARDAMSKAKSLGEDAQAQAALALGAEQRVQWADAAEGFTYAAQLWREVRDLSAEDDAETKMQEMETEAERCAEQAAAQRAAAAAAAQFMGEAVENMGEGKYKEAEGLYGKAVVEFEKANDLPGKLEAEEGIAEAKERQTWPERVLVLKLVAIQAQGLVDQGAEGGCCPYVKVKCNWDKKYKQKSPIVKGTSNPTWPPHEMKFVIKFGYRGVEGMALRGAVWDSNTLTLNKSIGDFAIPIERVSGERPGTFTGEQWFPTHSKGRVLIRWHVTPK